MDTRSILSSLSTVFGISVLAYILFVFLLFLTQEKLIFFPQRMSELRWHQVAEDVDGETISITAAHGIKLHGWFLPGAGSTPRPTVLFFGGNAMRLDLFVYTLDPLRIQGVNVLLVDYRGYGLSNGLPSTKAMQRDSELVYAAAIDRGDVNPDRIYLWGISIGTGIATHLASVRDVAGIIFFAPFTSLEDVAREAYPYFPVRLLLRHHLDNLSLAPKIQVPALIIHGDTDRIQDSSHAQKLAAAWGGDHELIILEDRGHNDLLEAEEAWKKVVEFIRK